MNKLKESLFVTKQIRQCERKALDELCLTEDDLMLRAAQSSFTTLKALYPDVESIAVFCGGGNNAGDGYVLARLAHQEGFAVTVYALKAVDDLPRAANQAAIDAIACGVYCQHFEECMDCEADLVVDALLGIGLQGEVREPYVQAIQVINDSDLPVLAIDIPSGLDADTGRVLGLCVKAHVTTTFIAEKVGLYLLDGPDFVGKVVCHSLQLEHLLTTLTPAAYKLSERSLQGLIEPRRKNSHKGLYGHVLVIGGGEGMPGAPYLAALAALRVGAGMVSVATRPEYARSVLPLLPEAMVYPIEQVDALKPLLSKATVCVIGPGLGESEWALSLFKAAVAVQLPLVVDASALRLLAEDPQHDDNWVLTPHPGEAAHLLTKTVAEIQLDRCQAAHQIHKQYGGCAVLKGVGTVVSAGLHDTSICTAGNPGMASAGMGDVLSGVIGGLLAQGLSINDAARLGVFLHAKAADDAVMTQGERGLLASDLMPYLRRHINQFC